MNIRTIEIDGAALNDFLKTKKINKTELASNIGCNVSLLHQSIKRGRMGMTQYNLMCLLLGVDRETFIPKKQIEEPKQTKADENVTIIQGNDEMIRVLKEIERNQREMLKAINLIKLDVATMRFAGEERDKTIGYIHKILGDFVDLFEDDKDKKKK